MDHRRKLVVGPCRQGTVTMRKRRSDLGAACTRVRSSAIAATRGALDQEPTIDLGRMRRKHYAAVVAASGGPAGTGRG